MHQLEMPLHVDLDATIQQVRLIHVRYSSETVNIN